MQKLSRRMFGVTSLGAVVSASVAADQRKKGPITAASVPEDPDAPEVSEGTQPEVRPFDGTIEFVRRDVAARVQPFALTDVKLLASQFLDAQETNRQYLHDLPVDRLMYVFRVNAGLPSKAQPLGGWEKPDCELRGHFVGHYLSACALMYSSTGDGALKAKGDELVGELAKCQSQLSNGYLSAFPVSYFDRLNARTKVWAPFYTVHKVMAGLLDMNQLCGNTQALQVLRNMADWTDNWTASMPEDHMQMVLDTEYGGMNDLLYNLAAATGNDRYAQVGDRFTKKRFFNPLALRRDELRGLHVNTHIPQVIGAARRYEISGDQRFRDVADYFWQEVTDTRCYATGGTSNNEGWLVGPNHLAKELTLGSATTECCCAYNMLKLTRKLYEWTADPRLFDYYERTLYNHRLGTIQADGRMQYYLGVVPGSWRTFSTKFNSFWCCDGTGVEEYSKLADSIYFHDASGIYVNLFVPSEVKWKEKNLVLRQETRFPDEARTRLVVAEAHGETATLHLRVPSWVAASARLKINGKTSDATAGPGSYVSFTRAWKKGDRVEMELPMALRYEGMADDPNLRAVLYGPLVLAGKLSGEGLTDEMTVGPAGPDLKKHPAGPIPTLAAGTKEAAEVLQAGNKPLTFHANGTEFAPFCRLSGQRYSIYWNMG